MTFTILSLFDFAVKTIAVFATDSKRVIVISCKKQQIKFSKIPRHLTE